MGTLQIQLEDQICEPCTVLYCTVLCCIVLYCTVLCTNMGTLQIQLEDQICEPCQQGRTKLRPTVVKVQEEIKTVLDTD